MWVSGHGRLFVESDGSKRLFISRIEEHQGDKLPSGKEVNPELADEHSALQIEARRVIREGGQIVLGRVRVFSGGGFYRLPASLLDVGTDGCCHDKMWSRICGVFGGEPEYAYPSVFRDWEAPGTWGVIEGGGSGRGDWTPTSSAEYIVQRCMGENFGEIGVLIEAANGEYGRLGYKIAPRMQAMAAHNDWLHDHVVDEWRKAHGQVPTPLTYANVTVKSLKDSMSVEGKVGMIHGVELTMEWASASVECLVQNVLDIQMPKNARCRFLDLESRGKKDGGIGHDALNRRIIVTLQRGDVLIAISYLRGQFDPNFPRLLITADTIPTLGNEKFAAMIKAIRS
jgi:hypothetical protein